MGRKGKREKTREVNIHTNREREEKKERSTVIPKEIEKKERHQPRRVIHKDIFQDSSLPLSLDNHQKHAQVLYRSLENISYTQCFVQQNILSLHFEINPLSPEIHTHLLDKHRHLHALTLYFANICVCVSNHEKNL